MTEQFEVAYDKHMNTAGVILDLYDDVHGRILKETIGDGPTPAFFKTAHLLDSAQLSALPDHLFALVAHNGEAKLRKYAMHDAGHLTTSILYFLKAGDILPEEAQKVAASNLVNACAWYDIEPPAPLVKKAFVATALNTMDLGNRAADGLKKHKNTMGVVRTLQKAAELTGTEAMPASGSLKSDKGRPRSIWNAKTAGWLGPVDLTGVNAREEQVEREVDNYALPDKQRYPIDSYEEVIKAAEYFDEYWGRFSPVDRLAYARNLAARQEELGVPVMGKVAEYANGDTYGTHIDLELLSRANAFRGTQHQGVYEELSEKRAGLEPWEFVEELIAADKQTGADNAYGKPVVGFRDPFTTVFGVDKLAEDADTAKPNESFSWNEGSDYVNDVMLRDFADNRSGELETLLGEDFRKDFEKDPIGVFKSMPDPQKHVIARLASDNSGGSYRAT